MSCFGRILYLIFHFYKNIHFSAWLSAMHSRKTDKTESPTSATDEDILEEFADNVEDT